MIGYLYGALPYYKPGVNSGTPKRLAVLAPLVAPVVLKSGDKSFSLIKKLEFEITTKRVLKRKPLCLRITLDTLSNMTHL